jgi:hypothetical protein
MTKKIKSNNHNTKSIQPAKKVSYKHAEEYRDFFTLKLTPAPISFLEKIAQQIVVWARDNDDALIIEQFCLEKGITEEVYYNWVAKYPFLSSAHNTAMMFLSHKREIGGLKRKYDPGMVMRTMPIYSNKWKQLAEWQSKLNSDDKTQGKIEVIINAIPDSKIVPEKK